MYSYMSKKVLYVEPSQDKVARALLRPVCPVKSEKVLDTH